ncbi:MAG: hypothetical protein K8R60_02020 [Burkholderiales bacterium]|nr:hypothetical protein [Burkholderiales bacterium]
MSPECKTAAARAAATLLLMFGIAGCSVFKNNEEAQTVINQRVVGMAAGDFFQRYGVWGTRREQVDGTIEYGWVSAVGATTNSGYYGLDDRTCTMKIIAAKDGRIIVANILQDMPGRTTTSRCGELFKAA